MRRSIVALGAVVLTAGGVWAGVSMFYPSVVPTIATLGTASDVRAQIDHQGVVAVSGVRFTGTGQFKFAIRDPDTSSNVWTNSTDTSPADGVPDSAVSLTVTDGVYSVRLGDTGITNMDAISSSLFADGNLQLRIWFNDGTNGWQQLSPDHSLTSLPYAFAVADASVATSKLADDAVTSAKILNDAVTSSKILNDAVTSAKILDGAVTSAKITDGTIANVDVNSSAAIAWSKLSTSGAVPSDVGAQAADADLDDLADGSLSGSKVGSGISASNVTTGTLSGSLVGSGVSASNVTTGTLSGSLVGSGVNGANLTDATVTDAKLATGVAIPVGAVLPYAGSSAPTGWLLCDGSAVSRTTYATLFSTISTTYGAGNGSTTFNVPDLRGRVNMGAGTGTGGGASGSGAPTGGSALSSRSSGAWGGEETHTLSTNEMPSHTHGGPDSNDRNVVVGGGIGSGAGLSQTGSAFRVTTALQSAGGGAAHNVIQPFTVMNQIIKY